MCVYLTLFLCLLHMSKLRLNMHDFTSFFQVHTSKSRHKKSPSLHLKHLCIFFWTMHCLIFLHIIYNFVNNNTKYKDWCVLSYAFNYFTLWFSFLSSGRRMNVFLRKLWDQNKPKFGFFHRLFVLIQEVERVNYLYLRHNFCFLLYIIYLVVVWNKLDM